jgi:Mg/Co/Ni transporter MgtE
LHAGQQSKRIIWTGLVVGGLVAAIGACSAYYFLGWSITASIGLLLIIAIVVAAILTGYSWLRNDFYTTD